MNMKVAIRIPTEIEGTELVITNSESEDLVYVTIGECGEIVEVNVEELKLALRKIATK